MVRARTRMIYQSLTFQFSISLVIMFGFLLDMVEAQVSFAVYSVSFAMYSVSFAVYQVSFAVHQVSFAVY